MNDGVLFTLCPFILPMRGICPMNPDTELNMMDNELAPQLLNKEEAGSSTAADLLPWQDWDAIGIGWDVRGWQGKAQAVALVGWRREEESLHWLGVSPLFRLSSRSAPDIHSLLMPLLKDKSRVETLLRHPRLALGIDAPLAFPRAFTALLRGEDISISIPEREIDNPYAYRDCERWIHAHYRKKPLSASFDRLGNNATLALAMLPALAPLQLVPRQRSAAPRALLEVYPALAKQGGKRACAGHGIHALLPEALQPGTDQYDAALCALMALQYAAGDKVKALPPLQAPPADFPLDEGWMYHFVP
jgi:predicted nuclease with RNAse H fold